MRISKRQEDRDRRTKVSKVSGQLYSLPWMSMFCWAWLSAIRPCILKLPLPPIHNLLGGGGFSSFCKEAVGGVGPRRDVGIEDQGSGKRIRGNLAVSILSSFKTALGILV
jgi:hypothetical protein